MHQVRLRAVGLLAGTLALLAGVLVSSPALAAVKPPRLGSRVLREGMRGGDVRILQSDLTKAGFRTPAVGIFGPITLGNVDGFARTHHLLANGVVNVRFVRVLQAAIRSKARPRTKARPKVRPRPRAATPATTPTPATAPTPAVTTAPAGGTATLGQRTLQEGMSGPDVSQLQTDLTAAGYPTGDDGQFGPATMASVKAFEQANNLTADGTVTAADAAVLQQLSTAAQNGVAQASAPQTSTFAGQATLNPDGTATAPANAPLAVQQMIAAANQIIHTPYVYGGGHQSFQSSGYDCSGAVSYVLHGAGLLSVPEDSTGLETFGAAGPGQWVDVFGDPAHAFIVIAGLAFDTAHYGPITPDGTGPRWLAPGDAFANLGDGGSYVERHPAGL